MAKLKWPYALGLCALASFGHSLAQEPRSAFTPRNGFSGHSQGNGSLRLFLGKARPFHVDSQGTDQADGTFRLEQVVTFQGEPSQRRTWLLHSTSAGRYRASLTDAAGPVTGFTDGSRLFLHYRVKGPLVMHQELELRPDGRTIDNTGTITFLGIPVGRLHEIILR